MARAPFSSDWQDPALHVEYSHAEQANALRNSYGCRACVNRSRTLSLQGGCAIGAAPDDGYRYCKAAFELDHGKQLRPPVARTIARVGMRVWSVMRGGV